MAVDPVPWGVGGGAEHTPEIVRQSIYDSTGGAEGISSVGALLVRAQAVPNGTVRVYPGGALINNRYSGGSGQSYSARNATQTSVAITATGSAGGRTDAIVMRILDPQYEGQPPANPNNFQYTRLEAITAPPGITRIEQLGLTYPAILLARVTIPVSTGAITNAMITDLREVANPKVRELVFPRPSVTMAGLTLNSRVEFPAGEWFPNAGGQDNNGAYYADVPLWATRMQIRMEWLGVRYFPNAGYGLCWVSYGPGGGGASPTMYTQSFQWDASGSAQTQRNNWVVHDEVPVPASLRGTRTAFVGRANKTSPNNSSYNGVVDLNATSGMVFSVRFLEVADSEVA